MKYTVKQFADKFRSLVGDSTIECPDRFIIDAINWAFNDLPLSPKLDKVFTKNYRKTLKPGHYRWNLSDHKDFRRFTNMPVFSMFTSEGGNLCPFRACAVTPEELYASSVPSMMQEGRPCKYALEQEDDEVYLVFDRPIDKPIILQYTAYGFPTNVTSMNDEVRISAVIENALLSVMTTEWYREADDLAFAGAMYDYLDNKYIPQIIQMINKSWHGVEGHVILGV